MDPAERRYLEDYYTPGKKIIIGAALGLAFGTLGGTIVPLMIGVPLIRSFKIMRNCGLSFGAFGGMHIGFQQVLEKYQMKRDRDRVMGTAEACLVGATLVEAYVVGETLVEACVVGATSGKRVKSIIPRALVGGSALAFTWAFADAGGQTTRIDNGKEDSAYTVE